MIFGARVVPGVALCIALVTVASLFYAAIGDVPRTFFGGEDTFIVAPPDGKLVGTQGVPTALVGPLRSLDSVSAASPEIFVATSLDGRSIMARGVDFESFMALEGATLVEGALPVSAQEALASEGFARAFDLAPGDHIVLPGSLAATAADLRIVGIIDVAGTAGEELMISLPAARGLALVKPEEAHLIRVSTIDRLRVKSLVESVGPTFTYSDVELSALRMLPGEPVTMTANLTNWGRIDGIKVVQVRQEGIAIAEKAYRVGPFVTIPVRVDFALPDAGRFNISINPTFEVDVGESNLTFSQAPDIVVAGQRFVVRLRDVHGNPMEGARLSASDVTAMTDVQGYATLSLPIAGRVLLHAERDAQLGEVGVRRIYVVDAALSTVPSGQIVDILLPSFEFGTKRDPVIRVELENRGGVAGDVSVALTVNGTAVGRAKATLDPGERNISVVTLQGLPTGNVTLRAVNGTANATLRVVQGEDPRLEALLRGYDLRANSSQFSSASGNTADEYVKRTVGNITAVVLLLSFASGALASLGAGAIIARHLAERRRNLGVLKSIGARNSYILELATWEVAPWAALASCIGVGAGVLIALAIDATGLVRAFGHAVHPRIEWATLGVVLILGALIPVLVARGLTRGALQTSPDALLRDDVNTEG